MVANQLKGDLTKERIIREALVLFNQFGVEGTSIADLMAATQLEKGGIYRHFASKEEILEGAIRYYISQIEHRLARATEGIESPAERLLKILESFISISENPVVPGGCFIMNMAVDSDFTDGGTHPLVITSFKRWERLFVSEIQKGIQLGLFRKDVDAKSFAALAICAIEGSIVLAGAYPRLQSSQIVKKHLFDLVNSFIV